MRVTHRNRQTWICNRTNLRGRRKRGWGRGRGRKALKGKGKGALPSIHNSPPFFPIPYPLFTHVYCYLPLQRNYKKRWVWSSGWTLSCMGLLLLTVTDISTTFAEVIFRVEVSCITRQLMVLYSGCWPDWSIKWRCYFLLVGLSVKSWY